MEENQQTKQATEPTSSPQEVEEKQQTTEEMECFSEPAVPEFDLQGRWVFWEHFEDVSGGVRDRNKNYMNTMQKVAWFNDLVSFTNVWQNIPHSDVANFFYNKNNQGVPVLKLEETQRRINAISVFKKGIEPTWEDEVNAQGGDFQVQFGKTNGIEPVQKIWEELVFQVATQQFSNINLVTGVRILDKCRDQDPEPVEGYRIEIWVTLKERSQQEAKEIEEHILKHFCTMMPGKETKVAFKSHGSH